MKKKIVLIYSGGLDSTVLLYDLLSSDVEVVPLSIDYGQRHAIELVYASKICDNLGLRQSVIDLSDLSFYLKGSSQTDSNIPVPEGHYEDISMQQTVVPNRNMIMLAVAAGVAISTESYEVAYAAHAGDHTIYPDCRPEFASTMQQALYVCHYKPVGLRTPYIHLTKGDIVKRGKALRVPFDKTWSCYQDGPKHCGICGTCTERKEAFKLAQILDPTEYIK